MALMKKKVNQLVGFINIVVNENDVNIKIIEEGKIREECKKSEFKLISIGRCWQTK